MGAHPAVGSGEHSERAAALGRFAKDDPSTSMLIAFVVSALATLAGLLFLAGEVASGTSDEA